MRLNRNIILSILGVLSIVFSLYILISYTPQFSRDNIDISNADNDALEIKKLIEENYQYYKDFDKIDSFAGTSIKYRKVNKNYYFAYITHGSGLPIVSARCFKVDSIKNITYKDLEQSDIVSGDIDITTCRLISETSNDKDQIKYYKVFNFVNRSVIFSRMGSGQFNNTFWDKEFVEVRDIKSFEEKDIVSRLYTKGIGYYYLPYPVDQYYELFPGFYRKFIINKSLDNINKLYDDGYKCNLTEIDRYNKKIYEQECIHEIDKEDGTKYLSKFTNCHFQLQSDIFVSYIQIGNVLDGNYNLCNELDEIGLQDWN